MKLDLRQLRHVLALDRHRNFGRAAEAIGLTQPALSRSLQALEDEIGARLFDRDRSHVAPTAVGERLIERARLLVNQARDIEQDLKQMLGLEVGLLRIGAGPYPRTEVTKKIWAYIKRNGLQDKKNRRNINADDKLKPVFGGKSQVSMFEMTKLVNKHLK